MSVRRQYNVHNSFLAKDNPNLKCLWWQEHRCYSQDVGEYPVYWSGFRDLQSGLAYFRVGLGSQPNETDIQPFVYVGLQTCRSNYCLLFSSLGSILFSLEVIINGFSALHFTGEFCLTVGHVLCSLFLETRVWARQALLRHCRSLQPGWSLHSDVIHKHDLW